MPSLKLENIEVSFTMTEALELINKFMKGVGETQAEAVPIKTPANTGIQLSEEAVSNFSQIVKALKATPLETLKAPIEPINKRMFVQGNLKFPWEWKQVTETLLSKRICFKAVDVIPKAAQKRLKDSYRAWLHTLKDKCIVETKRIPGLTGANLIITPFWYENGKKILAPAPESREKHRVGGPSIPGKPFINRSVEKEEEETEALKTVV